MNILFLLIPVALMGALAVFRGFTGLTLSDSRGITLQTVIVTAVLALAAAGAGIVIYNVVSDEAADISKNAGQACAVADGIDNEIRGALPECDDT